MKKIRWGIIGTGNIANSFARDFAHSKDCELIAVASRSLEKAKQFARKFDIKSSYGLYEALFNDPAVDVVYIATPHTLHFENASEALSKGKAVVCEKPIATNPKDCLHLMEISSSVNTYLMEAMWTYFLPPILTMRKWIADNRIGTIRKVKAEFGFKAEYKEEGRLFNPELAGGALLDIGIYPIAITWLIFQQLPKKIFVSANKAPTGVDIEETMNFEYDNGAQAQLRATFMDELSNETIIIGDDGYIKIPDFFMAKECFLYDNDDKIIDHFRDARSSAGYNYEIDAVNRDLGSGKKQSEVMPLSWSLKLQEIMAMVSRKF